MSGYYAICENGGTVNEHIRGQFETPSEAWGVIEAQYDWEQEQIEDGWCPEELNTFDVVYVHGDGSITTEC